MKSLKVELKSFCLYGLIVCDTAHRPGVGEGRRVGVAEEKNNFLWAHKTVFVSYIIFFKMASTALKEPADVTMQNDMVWHDKNALLFYRQMILSEPIHI